MRQLTNAYLETATKQEVADRWRNYRDVMDEWNVNLNSNRLNSNRILIHRYFGETALAKFCPQLQNTFIRISKTIEQLLNLPLPESRKTARGITDRLDCLNEANVGFADILLEHVINGEDGSHVPRSGSPRASSRSRLAQ
jgi:hypothetical protein